MFINCREPLSVDVSGTAVQMTLPITHRVWNTFRSQLAVALGNHSVPCRDVDFFAITQTRQSNTSFGDNLACAWAITNYTTSIA